MTSAFKKNAMDFQELTDALREKFGDDILSLDIHAHNGGKENTVQSRDLWIEIAPAVLRPFIEHLFEYDFVNFHVISGDDVEDSVVLNYHLSLFQRTRCGRLGVTLSVRLPKTDLSLPSIFDLLPGSEYSERETREMWGVNFVGLPNKALVFLPDDWNEEIKPWRRDGAGPDSRDVVRELD